MSTCSDPAAERARLQVLSDRVADAFGLDRTVPPDVAAMHVAYKRYAYAIGTGDLDGDPATVRALGLGLNDWYVVIRLPKGAPAMLIPGEVVHVPHCSDPDGDVVAVATRIPRREDLPPVVGHPQAGKSDEVFDRWEAWVGHWLAERYPEVAREIAAYRSPAKLYAASWDALMPALQVWLRDGLEDDIDMARSQAFWRHLAELRVPEAGGFTLAGQIALAVALCSPEDVCNAVLACGSAP